MKPSSNDLKPNIMANNVQKHQHVFYNEQVDSLRHQISLNKNST